MNWSQTDMIEWLFENVKELTGVRVDNHTGEVTLYGTDTVFTDYFPYIRMPDISGEQSQTLYQRYSSYGDYLAIIFIDDGDLAELILLDLESENDAE